MFFEILKILGTPYLISDQGIYFQCTINTIALSSVGYFLSRERIVGFLVIASLLVIFLPYLKLNQNAIPEVSGVLIPEEKRPPLKKMAEIKKELDTSFNEALAENQKKSSFLQEKAWTIQLVSFEDAGRAEFLVQRLRARGYSAYKRPFWVEGSKTVTRVYVGPWVSLEKAEHTKEQIQKEEAFQSLQSVILPFRPLSGN